MIKPKVISKGDTIGIIAPASPVKDINRLYAGLEVLNKLGFKTVIGDSCFKNNGFLAGDDELRARDIDKFFNDGSISGIICMRGGYGSIRLLDLIDYRIIKNNPKVFVGYSDITALHSAFHKNCNLVTFHGPMVASDLASNSTFEICGLLDAINGKIKTKRFKLNAINSKDVSGEIIGGNLTVLSSTLGTKFEENFSNKILMIEDIDEEPYKIDRMLYQLLLSGRLMALRGVILGQFTNCEAKDLSRSLSLNKIILDFLTKLQIPVYTGIAAGHGQNKITIPLGVNIKILEDTLYFMEEGVQ